MSSLEQFGKYCDINATDPTTILYYVIKYLSEPYILQEYQTTDGQVIKAGEPLFKPEYLSLIKSKYIYWQQHVTNHSVIISTHTIFHPCLEVSVMKILKTFPGEYIIKISTPGCIEKTNLYRWCISWIYYWRNWAPCSYWVWKTNTQW